MLRLSIYSFIYYSSTSAFIAFLPLFFQYEGISTTKIGLILAVGPFVSIIAQPFWGYISDKRQTIKKLILLLLFITLLLSAGVFLIKSFVLLLLAITLFMFFMMPIQPLSDSLTTTYAQENQVSYGSIRLWGSLGFSFSAFIIGLLIGKFGIEYIGLIYGGILIISIISATTLTDSTAKKKPLTGEAVKTSLRNPKFLFFLFTTLMIAIPHKMNDNLLALYMKSLGAGEGQIGSAWTVSALSEAPVIALMAFLMKRFSKLKLIAIAGFFYSIRWLLYSFLNDPSLLVLSQAMHSVTFAIFFVAALQYVTTLVPSEMLATGQTVFFAVFGGLAGIIGSSAGGFLMDHFGPEFVYRMGSLISLIGAIMCTWMYFQEKRNAKNAEPIFNLKDVQ